VVEIRRVVDKAPLLVRFEQPRMSQFLEVEGERCRRQAKLCADISDAKTVRPFLDQQPKDRKARFLRQRAEGGDRRSSFHDSSIVEV